MSRAAARQADKARHARPQAALPDAGPFVEWLSSHRLHWPLLALLLLAGALLTVFPVGLGEEDIWWHLKTGEWILANKAVPYRDIFTHTVPPDTRWVDAQWSFQALAAAMHRAAGWNALIGYRVLAVAALIAAMWTWLGILATPPLFRFLAIAVAFFASYFRFSVRPETPTFALLALQLCLYDSIARGRMRALAMLLALQWIWGNWHSSCILGIGLAVVFSAVEMLKARNRGTRNPTPPLLSPALAVFFPLAMLAVTLMNPNTWHTPAYALTESRRTYILEFRALDPRMLAGSAGLLLAVAAAGVRGCARRRQWFTLAVTALFAIQSVRMQRFLPYLAVASLPLQAEGWRVLAQWAGAFRAPVRIAACAAAVTVIAVASVLSFRLEPKEVLRLGLKEETAPVAAAEFVEKEKLQGRMYNEFDSGGYLLWRLGPERRVFVFPDSRLNGPVMDRVTTTDSTAEWRALFDEYGITHAVLACRRGALLREGATTANMIFTSWPDWRLVFWDDIAMVFVKDVPDNRDLIARSACRILPDLVPYRTNPSPDIPAVMGMLENPAMQPAIEQELLRAIGGSPQHFRAALLLGNLREIRNDVPGSIKAYEMAEALDPNSPPLLQCLGRWHALHGSPERAIGCLAGAVAQGAQGPAISCAFAEAYMRLGNTAEAARHVTRALQQDPSFPWAVGLKQKMGI